MANFLKRYASPSLFFYLGVIAHLVCVLLPSAFVTHDGPSHLYNAHLINQVLLEPQSLEANFHEINPNWLQPNLIGYLFLCAFQLVVPFLWAEKLTVALYVLLFAFGFRYFLRQQSKDADWYVLLILPFIFNAVLFWGFYNFLFALALSFYLIGYYEKHVDQLKLRHYLFLFLSSLFVFYSHALGFVFCALYIGVRQLIAVFNGSFSAFSHWKKSVIPALFLLPGTLLFFRYVYLQPHTETCAETPYHLFDRLQILGLKIEAITFSGYSEGAYAVPLYGLLVFLLVLRIWTFRKESKSFWNTSLWVLVFYFLAFAFTPDSAAGGSIIVLRLNLVFFLFLLVWLAEQRITRLIKSVLGVYFIFSMLLLVLRWNLIQGAATQTDHILAKSSEFVPKKALLSSVHFKPVQQFVGNYQIHTYFDMMSNVDHYAVLQQNAITLHNYETDRKVASSYFPVIWKNRAAVDIVWNDSSLDRTIEYVDIPLYQKVTGDLPSFILSVGEGKSQQEGKEHWDLRANYSEWYRDDIGFFTIYSLNE